MVGDEETGLRLRVQNEGRGISLGGIALSLSPKESRTETYRKVGEDLTAGRFLND
jgi:hypothetical protein